MQDFFKGKKITVMGLGLLGRGVGDIRFLVERGATVLVTDLKSKEALAESIQQLAGLPNLTFVLGEHRLADFRQCDVVLKGAGVPLDSPYIAEARKNNVPVEMSTSLFAALTPATIVGITGTRGKSTVTHLLHAIVTLHFRSLPEEKKKKVFLGGNVRGVSTLPFLPETAAGDVAVLELDSWQLQGFSQRSISPHLAVFTTFLPDHLNYYGGDMSLYFADKAGIFSHQKPDDVLVVGEQVARNSFFKAWIAKTPPAGNVIIAGAADMPDGWQTPLLGEHNRYNIGLARAAALAFGVPDATIKKAVSEFTGVPGRLQLVAERNGISFYNDTTATTPDATVAALSALSTRSGQRQSSSPIILIMGGNDKNLDMSALVRKIPETVKGIVFLPGTGTKRFISELPNLDMPITHADTMGDAVKKALEQASAIGISGTLILLSPAFTSFGSFANEFDRGEQFDAAVAALPNVS